MTNKIQCPYCEKFFYMITSNHLKKHNKTMAECREENPHISSKWYPSNLSKLSSYSNRHRKFVYER